MSTFDGTNHYFSGQGVVSLGQKNAITGKPLALIPVGNVSDLKLSIATTVVDHKESQTGQRGLDVRLQTDLKTTLAMTLESFSSSNLNTALRGTVSLINSGTVTAELCNGYIGAISGMQFINLSSVVVTQVPSTALTAYVDDLTPYDYKVNTDAGSIELNDGSVVAFGAGGVAATAVTVGATTSITVPNTAAVGDQVLLKGFTGADMASLNGKRATVVTATSSIITVNINTAAQTITATGTPKVLFDGTPLSVAYSYGTQYRTVALTLPAQYLWMRFEGLNTVETNSPVVVDVFRFSTDPLKELTLISDTIGQFVLEGSVLADSTQKSLGSYFMIRKLN